MEGKYHSTARLMGNGQGQEATLQVYKKTEEKERGSRSNRQQLSTSTRIDLPTFRYYITSCGETCEDQFNRGKVIGERTKLNGV